MNRIRPENCLDIVRRNYILISFVKEWVDTVIKVGVPQGLLGLLQSLLVLDFKAQNAQSRYDMKIYDLIH